MGSGVASAAGLNQGTEQSLCWRKKKDLMSQLWFTIKPRSMDNNSVLAAGWLKDVSDELHTGGLVADEPG